MGPLVVAMEEVAQDLAHYDQRLSTTVWTVAPRHRHPPIGAKLPKTTILHQRVPSLF
jgi:hypothetical protein